MTHTTTPLTYIKDETTGKTLKFSTQAWNSGSVMRHPSMRGRTITVIENMPPKK